MLRIFLATLVVVLALTFPRRSDGALRWDLSGKNVLITGGTKGIGRSIVDEMSNESMGAKCIITCSRSAQDLEECARQWHDRGCKNVHTIVADVSTQQGRDVLVAYAQQQFGVEGLHVLINNVGSNIRKPAIDYVAEDYQKIMSTNLESAFFLCIQCHDMLLTAARASPAGASVINVGSVAGGCGTAIRSGTIYAMTKAAMAQMSMNLGCEWAADNIRVNSVSPWYIRTPLAEQVLKNPDYLKAVLDRTPMKRVGAVEEVASAVLFLAMDMSQYITGQNIAMDGGFLRCGFF